MSDDGPYVNRWVPQARAGGLRQMKESTGIGRARMAQSRKFGQTVRLLKEAVNAIDLGMAT
jgi:hypothetical protein